VSEGSETETSTIPAVIMAGGTAKQDIIEATGVTNRALIPINGRPMVSYVVDALRGAKSVERIVLVGDLPDSLDYARVGDQGGFVENLFAGLEACRGAEYALVATADIPFVTSESVDDFVRNGRDLCADVVYPVVRVEECYRRFPGVKRTAASLRDGKLTGGNMVLMRPEFMLAQRDRIADAYGARKSPIRLALMLGIGTTLRAVVALTAVPSLLSVGHLEAAVGRLLGGTARAYVSSYSEIATDIDRPSDLEAIGK
jgi:GTP:adenosylcobinamide-phosphate guanylyltransferase